MAPPTDTLRMLQSVKALPSLPEIIILVEKVFSNPNASAQMVAAVLDDDPSMVTQLLRVANSALYAGASPQQCQTAVDAVTRLGFREARNICLATGVVRMFPSDGPAVNLRAFWRRSLVVANASHELASYAPPEATVERAAYYTGGLLHDIGVIAMEQFFHEEFLRSRELAKEEGMPIVEAEREVLGADHCEVGEELAWLWRLPASVAAAIRHHHDPEQCPPEYIDLARRVHVVVKVFDGNDSCSPDDKDVIDEEWRTLGLSGRDVLMFLALASEQAEKSKVFESLLSG